MKRLLTSATFLACITAFISGFSNFINKISVTAVSDPIAYTTLKNTLVALPLVSLFLLAYKWREITRLSSKNILKLILIGLIGGSLPFALFFMGLSQTSALNANLIHKTLFLWVLIFAIPFLKEKISLWQIFAVALMFLANLFVGGFSGFHYNTGELMILAATILWAAENIIAKSALQDISTLTVVTARMFLGSFLLLIIVASQGHLAVYTSLNTLQWGWTALSALLLFAYVTTWYTALKYAPATYVATLLVPATLVTNILTAVFITHQYPQPFVLSSAFYIIATVLTILAVKKIADQPSSKTQTKPTSLT